MEERRAAVLRSEVRLFEITLLGTHNSAANLSPALAETNGAIASLIHPSVATVPFQYINMVQRLSIFDQLEQGIRALHLELVGAESMQCASRIFISTCSCTWADNIALVLQISRDIQRFIAVAFRWATQD